MKTKTLVFTTAALSLLLVVSTFAQRGPGSRGQFPAGPPATQQQDRPDPLTGVQEALGLSAAQVEAIRALMTTQRESLQPLMQDLRGKQDALRTLQQSGNANPTDLGNAVAALQAAQAQIKAVHDKFLADFANVLTTDQRQVLEETRAAAERIPALSRLGLINGGPGGPRGFGGPAGRGGPRP